MSWWRSPRDQLIGRLNEIDRTLKRMEKQMSLDMSKVVAAAQRQTTVTNGVLQVLSDVSKRVDELSAQLAAAIASSDPVAQKAVQDQLDKLADDINANDDRLAAAIVQPGQPGAAPPPNAPETPAPVPPTPAPA